MRKLSHRKHQGKRLIKVNNNPEWKDHTQDPTVPSKGSLPFKSNVKTYMTLSCVLLAILVYPAVNLFKGLTLMDVSNKPNKINEQNQDTSTVIINEGQNKSPYNAKLKPVSKSEYNTMYPTADILHQADVFQPKILKGFTPRTIAVDGRTLAPVELVPTKNIETSVRVYLYQDFLSAYECDGLIRAHQRHIDHASQYPALFCFDSIHTLRKHMAAAEISIPFTELDFTEGTCCLNESMSQQLYMEFPHVWSFSTAFYRGESQFSTLFEDRVYQATGLTHENGGKFQITSYPPGVGYKNHTDCLVGHPDKRDRMATILVYLQDVEEGGETEFTELGIDVKPKQGQALVWVNMNEDGECDPTSLHQAAKVKVGHKYILQRWYYYQNFFTLGSRPTEPTLPPRKPGQPRITCDEYEHGSCRWYDEWDYNHILSYNIQKGGLT